MSTAICRAAKPGGSRWDVGVRSFAISSIPARHRLRTCARASRGRIIQCSQRAVCHLVALRNLAMLALLIASVVAHLSQSPALSSWAFIMRTGLKLALAAAILVWTGRAEPALSEPADFYKGKDIKLIVSATVGGGYDVYARALAKHLGDHIPGNPTIIPQNMPAAGGIAAAKSHVQRCATGRHRHLSAAEYRCIRAVLRQPAGAIRCGEIFLARHTDHRSGDVHRLACLEDQDALRRTDARDDDRGRRGSLDARVLWPCLQPALQHEGAFDHRLSRTERNLAGVGERRGRSHGLSVLVEHQDDAPGLVSAVQNTSLVSVRFRAPSGARGRAVRARSPAERR